MDRKEKVVCFDVDDTLVMWKGDGLWKHDEPGTVPVGDIFDPNNRIYLKPHFEMIEKLKELPNRGMYIIVWSAGGYEWATEVVYALKLNDYVHDIIAKPFRMYDDLPIQEGLGKTSYIEYKED